MDGTAHKQHHDLKESGAGVRGEPLQHRLDARTKPCDRRGTSTNRRNRNAPERLADFKAPGIDTDCKLPALDGDQVELLEAANDQVDRARTRCSIADRADRVLRSNDLFK